MKLSALILGGGFAGASVAAGIGERMAVTLVSDENFLLFTPMLAEAAAGDVDPRHIVAPLRQLAPRARLIQGRVASIDVTTNTAKVRLPFSPEVIEVTGDALVLALGSMPNTYGIPGADDLALPFKTIGDALRIRNRLLALLEAASTHPVPRLTRVAIVGAGYSGVELAGSLADFLRPAARRFYQGAPPPTVILIDALPVVTPTLPQRLGVAAERALVDRGVEVVLGTPVSAVEPEGVRLADGRLIEAGTVVWVAGVKPHNLVGTLGLPLDRGRLIVDEQLRAAPGLFALGDAAAVPDGRGEVSPPTAQFALRQGSYLGRWLPSLSQGRRAPPFKYATLGELVSIGHRNAVGKVAGVQVSGLVAWFLWRSYYLLRLPTLLRKLRVAADWALDLLFPPDIAWLPSSDLGPPLDNGGRKTDNGLMMEEG